MLAVSDGSVERSNAAVVRYESIANVLTGGFISIASFVTPAPPITCTAGVKFQLYRYR